MGRGVCRVGDTVTGICRFPIKGHPIPFTGTWTEGSDYILCDGISVILKGDAGITSCGHVFIADGGTIPAGEPGRNFQLVGDTVTVIGGGEGISITGSITSSGE